MKTQMRKIGRLNWRDELATTTLEYALLLCLLVLTGIASFQMLGGSTAESTRTANQRMTTVEQPAGPYNGEGGAPAAPTGS